MTAPDHAAVRGSEAPRWRDTRTAKLLYVASYHAAAYAMQGACYGFGAALGVLPVALLVWWLA